MRAHKSQIRCGSAGKREKQAKTNVSKEVVALLHSQQVTITFHLADAIIQSDLQ